MIANYHERLEGQIHVATTQLAVIGLAPGISVSTLAQTARMLEATYHFHGNLILVQHHLHWLVYVHILHIDSALAVTVIAVRKQMIYVL